MAEVDYPVVLETAWLQHLVPREPNAPTVISLFAGCGGSSLGYSMAGFRELLAVEWDKNAVDTFRLNFPDVPVYHGDICKLTVDECLRMTGLQPGELDVLDGSPPCQGFSTAGKRQIDDPRNDLFREYVRLLRGLRPKVLVMENVSGMVKGKMKLIFADILRELKASGYRVSARLMNAMYFHVPQSRQRMIFIGVRDDLGIEPSHPGAEARPISAEQAIGISGILTDGFPSGTQYTDKPCPTLPQSRALSVKTRSMKINPWMNGAAATLTKTCSDYQILEDGYIRRLTIAEARFLGSYPLGFRFAGTFAKQWACIGNSVPPLFLRAIARHIRANILQRMQDAFGITGTRVNSDA
jgi:DNA (cytosine-5)-methyltransferase 1